MHELRRDDFRERPTVRTSLIDSVTEFSTVRALVIGDAIEDAYHFGRVDRLSPEAPVPIFIEESVEARRGGADNVAHQLEVLGCRVQTVFAGQLSVKHRYFAGHHQVFRRDQDYFATTQDVDRACRRIADRIHDHDVVVLSDYAKGLLTTNLCQAVIRYGKPVIVDPKGSNWQKYRGATVICPNEIENELGSYADDWRCGSIVTKLGAKGVAIRTSDGMELLRIPAIAKQVFDVTGAGDVVTALIAAGIAINLSIEDCATIANYAAGSVVGKLGTAVCSKDELLLALRTQEIAPNASR